MKRFCLECDASYAATVLRCERCGVATLLSPPRDRETFLERVLDGRWRLSRLIGEGGMGTVFEAEQLSLKRSVAVKVIKSAFSASEESVKRFYREAEVLSSLQHPNIVKVFDFGQDQQTGSLYLVMELLRGDTLQALLGSGERLSRKQVLHLTSQLAQALGEAHVNGVIHRDLKPANLFIQRTASGALNLVVLDFGVVWVSSPDSALTQNNGLIGTPGFMAPEQVQGHTIDARADLYAVGVLLYRLISGVMPFQGDNNIALLFQQLHNQPPPLAECWRLAGPVDTRLTELVHRLLAVDPDQRPESAATLEMQLNRLMLEEDARVAAGVAPDEGATASRRPTHHAIASTEASPTEPRQRRATDSGPFLGREEEVAHLNQLLLKREGLVVILGPAGVGKTRLVSHVLAMVEPAGDLFWVDLRDVDSPRGLVEAMVGACHSSRVRAWDDLEALGVMLLRKHPEALWVFDNCETLCQAARDLLAVWRGAVHETRWWLTSQEPLNLGAGRRLLLKPLPTPAPGDDVALARRSPGVTLLTSLVRWRRGYFEPTEDELDAMVELVSYLDGNPLALTMAAGRMTLLDAGEVLTRLRQDLRFLRRQPEGSGAGARVTLHDSIARSLARLTAREREMWVQCSVFKGGFDVEAAESILAHEGESNDILDVLEALTQRFLLHPEGTRARLGMLNSLKQFAHQSLKATPRCSEVQARHAAWFAKQAQRRVVTASTDEEVVRWLLRERGNLNAALSWCLAEPVDDRSDLQLEAACWLVSALSVASRRSGAFVLPEREASSLLADVSPRRAQISLAALGFLMLMAANEAKALGERERFFALIDDALVLGEQVEDPFLRAALWVSKGTYLGVIGQGRDGVAAFLKADALLVGVGAYPVFQSRLSLNIAAELLRRGQLTEARRRLTAAVDVFVQHGIVKSEGSARLNLSLVLSGLGESRLALEELLKVCDICERCDNHRMGIEARLVLLELAAKWRSELHDDRLDVSRLLLELRTLIEAHGVEMDGLRLRLHELQLEFASERYERALSDLPPLAARMEALGQPLWSQYVRVDLLLVLLAAGRDEAAQAEVTALRELLRTSESSVNRAVVLLAGAMLDLFAGRPCPEQDLKLASDAQAPVWHALRALSEALVGFSRARETPRLRAEALQRLGQGFESRVGDDSLISDHALDLRLLLTRLKSWLTPYEQAQVAAWTLPAGGLLIDAEGRWFRRPDGSWESLERKPLLAKLLSSIAFAAEPPDIHTLVEQLYPDEKLLFDAGINRIHKSLSVLRRKGLKPYIKRSEGAYLLACDGGVHTI